MAPVDPYIQKNPNDLIRSGDWNNLQIRMRQEIRSHTHQGGEEGKQLSRESIQPHAIDGGRIDPASKVTVAQLKVNDRELLTDIDTLVSRANAFNAKLNSVEEQLGRLEMLSMPSREQLVSRRVIFGYAGDFPPTFKSTFYVVRKTLYRPFGSASDASSPLPDVQPQARRRFRLHAIYSDNIQAPGQKIVVRFEALDNPALGAEFFLERAWGSVENRGNRDGYSSWVDGVPFTTHGKLMMRTTQDGRDGIMFHMELQAWDFF